MIKAASTNVGGGLTTGVGLSKAISSPQVGTAAGLQSVSSKRVASRKNPGLGTILDVDSDTEKLISQQNEGFLPQVTEMRRMASVSPQPISEEREILLLQIRDLKAKIEKQKIDQEALLTSTREAQIELEKERENHRDLYNFMKEQLQYKQKELTELESRFMKNVHENDDIQTNLKSQLFIQTEHGAHIEGNLKDEIRALKDELFQLNDFKLQKIDIENELEEIKAQRDNEKRLHKEQIRDLEREIVREKDRLAKEMETRVKDIKSELLAQSKSRLDKATKMTIIENDQMSSELAFQTKQTLEMMEQNKRLMAENIEMKRRMELMQQLEKELSKKNTAAHKASKHLSTKIRELEIEINSITRRTEKDMSNLQNELESREENINDLESQLHSKIQENQKYLGERESLYETMYAQRREIESFKHDLQELLAMASAAFENIRRSSIQILGSAGVEQVLVGQVEEINLSEADPVIKYIMDKVSLHKTSMSQSKKGLFPPINSPTEAKKSMLRTLEQDVASAMRQPGPNSRPVSVEGATKTFFSFAAPLQKSKPPIISPASPTSNISTVSSYASTTSSMKLTTSTNGITNEPSHEKNVSSVGVQTESAGKMMFMLDKWMKDNGYSAGMDPASMALPSAFSKSPSPTAASAKPKRTPVKFYNTHH